MTTYTEQIDALNTLLAAFMTPAQVEAEYNVTERAVRTACQKGRLPSVPIGDPDSPAIHLMPRQAVHELWGEYHRQTGPKGRQHRTAGHPGGSLRKRVEGDSAPE